MDRIENNNALFVGAPAWHGKGVVVKTAPSTAEGIKLAGLDWDVELAPLFTADRQQVTHRAVRRKSDNKVLGVVGPAWHPVQNREAFAWFDPFIVAGEAALEAAGSLSGGRRVWVLARLNRAPAEIVPGDDVQKYLLLSNGHDGSLAVRCGFTPVRVVCQNTLTLAHSAAGKSQLIRFKHSSGVVQNLANVRETINAANAVFEATAEQYRALARRDINQADLKKYVRKVMEIPDDADKLGGRMRNILASVGTLFETGPGNALPGVRGTYWGAYNAVTDYLTHHRGKDADKRLDSLWYGDAATVNRRALEVALAMAL